MEGIKLLGEDIRWVFISFLYAGVATEIAVKLSTLIRNWRKTGQQRWPTLSHLILAGVVVGTSWLGWSLALRHGSYPPVTEIFGRPTLLVIVDFGLLVIYHCLVSGVNVDVEPQNDAEHTSYWIMVVLIGYVGWDFVTYFVIPSPETRFWTCSWMSVVCAIFAMGAFSVLRQISSIHPWAGFAADISLLALFLLYRVMKELRYELTSGACPDPLVIMRELIYHPTRFCLILAMWVFLLSFISGIFLAKLLGRPRRQPAA